MLEEITEEHEDNPKTERADRAHSVISLEADKKGA
jgi:hypothetical protein